jgi:hypothetical protein
MAQSHKNEAVIRERNYLSKEATYHRLCFAQLHNGLHDEPQSEASARRGDASNDTIRTLSRKGCQIGALYACLGRISSVVSVPPGFPDSWATRKLLSSGVVHHPFCGACLASYSVLRVLHKSRLFCRASVCWNPWIQSLLIPFLRLVMRTSFSFRDSKVHTGKLHRPDNALCAAAARLNYALARLCNKDLRSSPTSIHLLAQSRRAIGPARCVARYFTITPHLKAPIDLCTACCVAPTSFTSLVCELITHAASAARQEPVICRLYGMILSLLADMPDLTASSCSH